MRIVATPAARWKMVGIGVLLTAASALLATLDGQYERTVGLVGCVVFGGALLYMFWRAVWRPPSLELTREGFVDDTSGISFGFVPWAEVESVLVVAVRGGTCVTLGLRDPLRSRSALPRYKRLLNGSNRRFYGGDVFIPAHALGVPADRLGALMDDAWRASRSAP